MIRCRTLFGLMVFSLVFSFALASVAKKTPDGVTPAEEEVCDGAPNFGLCNAFCEAQDCDDLDELSTSCTQIFNNYFKITGYYPPCVCNEVCIDEKEACEEGVKNDKEVRETCRRKCTERCSADTLVRDGCVLECTQRCVQRVARRTCGPDFRDCIGLCKEQYCIQHPEDKRCVVRDCLPVELER